MTMTAAENISTPNLREREHYQIVETLNFEFGVRFFYLILNHDHCAKISVMFFAPKL